MTERTGDLDVVVLGGGGHVGLPLSLAFADAGLTVGIYDTNHGHARPDRRRRDAVRGDRRRRAASRILPTGRLAFGADGSMIERTDHLVVVIGTPVDEFLGSVDDDLREGGRPDRAAPARGCARRPAQHRLSRDDRLRRAAPGRARLHRRRRVLPGADRRGPRARGAPHAAPDHRRRRRPRGRASDRAVRRPRQQDHPDDDQGSRAGQAVHQHLALHEVRGRQPVLHDRPLGRGRLHEHPATRSARTTRARPTCPAPASPPGRACSRTRCSCPPSPPTTSRSARPRCRSTKGCRPTSCPRSSAATTG